MSFLDYTTTEKIDNQLKAGDVCIKITQDSRDEPIYAQVSIGNLGINNVVTRFLDKGDDEMLSKLYSRLIYRRETSSLVVSVDVFKSLPAFIKVNNIWVEDADKTGITLVAEHPSGCDYTKDVFITSGSDGKWNLVSEDDTVIATTSDASLEQVKQFLASAICITYDNFKNTLEE